MSLEDHVSYNIMHFLKENGWNIVQYHPPGGQACNPIPLGEAIIYIDIIAYKRGSILVLENKGGYSTGDIRKLDGISKDSKALAVISKIVSQYLVKSGIVDRFQVGFYFGHGFSGRSPDAPCRELNLLHVQDDSSVRVVPSIINPLVI